MKAILFGISLAMAASFATVQANETSDKARAMAGALKGGINQDADTKAFVSSLNLGTAKSNAKGAVPSKVSGGGNGGWGNIGSTLTSPDGTSISGR